MLEKILSKAKTTLYEPIKNQNKILEKIANAILSKKKEILAENEKDLKKLDPQNPKYDRLKLNNERIDNILQEITNITTLKSPIGEETYRYTTKNGVSIKKIKVPLGVVCLIYESRPNVTIDAFSLCFKTGNVCLLKGGKEAQYTNQILVHIVQETLVANGISKYWINLLNIKRDQMPHLLTAQNYIDVIIPRGGKNLINYVRQNATVPTIETGAGVVHAYIDESANMTFAQNIINNAKTRRVSVCNALDTVLIHENLSNHALELFYPLQKKKVEIYADEITYQNLKGYPHLQKASTEHFGMEFLDYKMSCKIVPNIEAAVQHINIYGSKHSETIISQNQKNIEYFYNMVDASTVYANTSTAFTDGAQFGLGAEIGISTQKTHARGPMGLDALTTTKYIVNSNGQTRS